MIHRTYGVRAIAALVVMLASPSFGWQCRVGIGGGWASGYAGLLARQGIPHEFVLDHQLADAAFLRQYDALIVASLHASRLPQVAAPLERYVRGGGKLLFCSGYGLSAFTCNEQVDGEQPLLAWYCAQGPQVRRSAGAVVPADPKGPWALDWTGEETSLVVQNRVGFDFPGGEPLVRYKSVSVLDSAKKQNLPEAQNGEPAIVRVPRGKGYYLMSSPALGVGMGLYGVYADALTLALVRLMTDGQGVPQLTAEGMHLDRHQSAAGGNATPDAEDPTPVVANGDAEPLSRPTAPGGAAAPPEGYELLFDEPEPEFAAFGVYQPPQGEGQVVLNYANPEHHWAVYFTPERVSLWSFAGGKRESHGEVALAKGTARVSFVIKERRDKLSVFLPGPGRLQAQTDQLWRGVAAYRGAAFTDWRAQPLAPIYFTDDFMRTGDQQGEWETPAGTWQINSEDKPETSANPFTYVATPGAEALAVAGYGFWDTYRHQAVVRPDAAGGSVGLVAYYVKPNNYWLFRTRVNDTPTSFRDGFELVRVIDGTPEVLAKEPGGLVKGQWYRLSMRMIDKWVGAFVDGEKVLTAEDTHFSGGKVGLWTDGCAATFDDVHVTSAYSQEESPEVFRGVMPSYAGMIDQDTWAGPASQWRADSGQRGLFWNRGAFFGDAGVQLRAHVLQQDNVRASLLLMPETKVSAAGYRLAAARRGNAIRCELTGPGGRREAQVPVADEPALLSLRREGSQIIAQINGQDRLTVAGRSAHGAAWKLGFRTEGAKPRLSSLTYWSDHTSNDTFQTAPCRWWVGRGNWDLTSRWSCQPEWSWYGGISPVEGNKYSGPAVIWSKSRFVGDLVVEFYTAAKMIPNPAGKGTLEQLRDFNASLCGDGKDVHSGYSFVVGPGGQNTAKILRKGQVVATEDAFLLPLEGHNRWIHLTVRRAGHTVSLDFDGQRLLTYDDPDPLPDGYAALWTNANGIIIPRVTIHYAQRETKPLSLALAPPPADEAVGEDVGKAQTFAEAAEGWYSLDDQATPQIDAEVAKDSPGSLAYRYTPREGAFAVLLSPELKVTGAKTLSFNVRCSIANEVVFTLMEADRSRYLHTVKLRANEWRKVSLRLDQLPLAPDSEDENGQLDTSELQHFTITDMDAVKAFQGRAKEAPERTVWLDDLQFS